MDYLITGYPHGNGRYIEVGKVTAESKEDALEKVHKSIWYRYHATEFSQQEYDELQKKNTLKICTV